MKKVTKNNLKLGGIVSIIASVLVLALFLPSWGMAEKKPVKENIVHVKAFEGLSTPMAGLTNSAGEVTFVIANDYTVIPNVQTNIIGGTDQLTAVTTMTKNTIRVKVTSRQSVSLRPLLPLDVLLSTTLNAPNVQVQLLVTANSN